MGRAPQYEGQTKDAFGEYVEVGLKKSFASSMSYILYNKLGVMATPAADNMFKIS
jgi:hypothetical protein